MLRYKLFAEAGYITYPRGPKKDDEPGSYHTTA
jgi:hypothetical protein